MDSCRSAKQNTNILRLIIPFPTIIIIMLITPKKDGILHKSALPSRQGLQNTLTASLQRSKTRL